MDFTHPFFATSWTKPSNYQANTQTHRQLPLFTFVYWKKRPSWTKSNIKNLCDFTNGSYTKESQYANWYLNSTSWPWLPSERDAARNMCTEMTRVDLHSCFNTQKLGRNNQRRPIPWPQGHYPMQTWKPLNSSMRLNNLTSDIKHQYKEHKDVH